MTHRMSNRHVYLVVIGLPIAFISAIATLLCLGALS